MRTIEQPIPFIQQGERPWCWAACCAMAIGYYKPARYAPAMERIVEFVKLQPIGACDGEPPDESIEGSELHFMRLAIHRLGHRRTSTLHPLSAKEFHSVLAAGDVVIFAVRGHVMVGSGVRFPEARYESMEVRMHDPALPNPYWTHYRNIEGLLTDCIVVHIKEYV